jgi:hypothetical protein
VKSAGIAISAVISSLIAAAFSCNELSVIMSNKRIELPSERDKLSRFKCGRLT